MKKLYRSDSDKQLAGIAGGLGDYFDVDPTIVRIAIVVLTIFTGFAPGIVAYLLLAIIIPRERQVK